MIKQETVNLTLSIFLSYFNMISPSVLVYGVFSSWLNLLWLLGPRPRWATRVEAQSTWPRRLSLWMTPATLSSPMAGHRRITWRPAVKWSVSAGSLPWNWPKPRRPACRLSQVKHTNTQVAGKKVLCEPERVLWEWQMFVKAFLSCCFFCFLVALLINRWLGGRLFPIVSTSGARTRWRVTELRGSVCSQNTRQQGGGSQHVQRPNFKAWLCSPEVRL